MARLFRATGIVTNQPTHFYRHSGANHAHDAGASLSAIQIHGGWQPNGGSRLNTHYLHPLPKGVAYAMAGAFQPGLPPWVKRDCLTPPIELQRQIFPFIEEDYYTECPDWLLWTSNIMEGKSELEGRPKPMPMPDESNRAGVLRLKFLLLLVHLRKVLLQDAAALLELNPKDGVLYGHHHIFNLPVFKSPEFLVFKERLVAKMLTLAPPQSDSLRHNAPYLEAEFRLLNSTMAQALQAIKRQLDQKVEDISAEFKESLRNNTNTITNTIKTVSSVQTTALLAAIGDDQDLRAQAMLMVLQAMPGLYHQSLLKLKRLNSSATAATTISAPVATTISAPAATTISVPAATTVSAPLQLEPMTPLQRNRQSYQATPPEDYLGNTEDHLDNTEDRLDNTEDNEMEALELETSSTELLDAMDTDENLAQVTQDVAPRLPPMQVQSAPSSGPNLSLEERLDLLAVEIAESRCIIEFDVSNGFTYEMISRSRPLGEHWEEWFYGLNRDGLQQPSIYWLNGVHRRHTFANSHIAATTWRYVDPTKSKNSYNVLWTFKKAVVRGVLKIMLEREGDIMHREKTALAEVAASIQHTTTTLNQFQKINRKN